MPWKPPPANRTWIWQQPGWPALRFDAQALAADLDAARLQQGRLIGQLDGIGLPGVREISRDLWIHDAMATAAIEGEKLDMGAVRSSVARRLGLDTAATHDRHVDGLVEVMQDATQGYKLALTRDRLCRWQSALFPGGTAGIRRIAVGRWRDHEDAMQIVSGYPGREVVHYTAPPSRAVPAEMGSFLKWFAASRPTRRGEPAPAPAGMHGLVRAAIAHLWFESIHPFEDGNGRLGRAIADMAIAQDLDWSLRVFSLSQQMMHSRNAYYDALNAAQVGGLEITPWVRWFVRAFAAGCIRSQNVVKQAVDKAEFRKLAATRPLSQRQLKVLHRLLEAGDGGFLGGMTADKYSKITGASKATATRDLADLLQHGLLVVEGVGKATRYAVNVTGWNLGMGQNPET